MHFAERLQHIPSPDAVRKAVATGTHIYLDYKATKAVANLYKHALNTTKLAVIKLNDAAKQPALMAQAADGSKITIAKGNNYQIIGNFDSKISKNNNSGPSLLQQVDPRKNTKTLWNIVENHTAKVQYSFNGKLVNLYRDQTEKYWWAKDVTNHGGSYFKVFVKEGKIFKWVADADQYGNFIANKHKSITGMIIKPK
ncbi:MAG: hypothetical protein BWY54_00612 [Candidatus Dependentiae bacterium ADurb.Bin331]|nr:MAG: hypothetical protein BWY54_00612 [Candidatus Dependentiae bacterium ADurb.Bin331]